MIRPADFAQTRRDYMLRDIKYQEKPEKEELKSRLKQAKEELFSRQMKLKENKLPVIVLVEGWGTSGKGAVIGGVIESIDPRFFKVAAVTMPTPEEKRKPWLARFFEPARLFIANGCNTERPSSVATKTKRASFTFKVPPICMS